MTASRIEWTDEVWNPVTGCTKVSDGCKHCYAERIWPRFYGKTKTRDIVELPESCDPGDVKLSPWRFRKFTDVRCHPDRLEQPLHWKRPRMVFVNSMADLFHEDVPFDFIDKVFAVMALSPDHTFQILTKRPERMLEYMASRRSDSIKPFSNAVLRSFDSSEYDIANGTGGLVVKWPLPNVWLGVSVEDQATADERIPLLLETPAALRWISAEPMLGAIEMEPYFEQWPDYNGVRIVQNHIGIDWVVAGGESGPKARPMNPYWARSLRDQCQAAGVPFFFKQWGEYLPEIRQGTSCTLPDLKPNQSAAWGDGESTHVVYTHCGKKAAGCLLDGVEHKEYPEAHHA